MGIEKQSFAVNTVIFASANNYPWGTSLVVQWLRLCASNAGSACSIPGPGAGIPHAAQRKNNNKKLSSGT